MLLLVKIIALQLAMAGTGVAYLAAQQQVFLPKPLPKALAWSVFTVCSVVASIMLSVFYHPLAASLITLVVVMFGWVILALGAPYYPKWKMVLPGFSLLMLATALMGNTHVG